MNELTISLDPHRKTPLYEQIYGFIREEIRGGRIRAGERLSVGEPEYRGSGV